MTAQLSTAMLAAAVALAAWSPAYADQDLRANASRAVALRLRPDTLAVFINNLAGLRVRLVGGVVDEVASPRVFTVRNERSGYMGWPEHVAIVVDRGSAAVRAGAPLVVTGIARTLLGADVDSLRPLPPLTKSERTLVAKFPLVMASSVETPDGVPLLRSDP